jgi:hypothetical protein
VDEVEECESLGKGECTGITNEPLPSRQERVESLCPNCRSKVDKTTLETEDKKKGRKRSKMRTLFDSYWILNIIDMF